MDKDNTKPASSTPEKIEYNFKCGIKAYQQEATYKQDKALLSLFKNLNLEGYDDLRKMKISDILGLVLDSDLLLGIFDVILKTSDMPAELKISEGKTDWSALKRSEVIQVIKDFFVLSPELTNLLGTGKSGAVI